MTSVYRFVIRGNDEASVHGRQYRRKIKMVAGKLTGCVKNIKGNPEIEVFVATDDAGVKQFIKTLNTPVAKEEDGFTKEELKSLKIGEDFHEVPWVHYSEFKDFEIVREDELTEMVWALQGAGDVFLKTLKAIQERDKKKETAILTSLSAEVENNLKILEEPKRENLMELRYVCLESQVSVPIVDTEDYVSLVQDSFYHIKDIEKFIKTTGSGIPNAKTDALKVSLGQLKSSIETKLNLS